MASKTASIIDRNIQRVHKAGPIGSANRIQMDIAFTNGNNAVTGGTDTVDIDLSVVANAALRSGETLTPRSVSVKQCAQSSSTEYAATVAISSSTLQLSPKSVSNWSTDANLTANALVVPYIVTVLCDVT
jgi:hypothetical protein